jgi:hypothetical protein
MTFLFIFILKVFQQQLLLVLYYRNNLPTSLSIINQIDFLDKILNIHIKIIKIQLKHNVFDILDI